MQLESLYQEIILDHYRSPQGRGLREPFQAQVHHVNPTCGDEITLRVSVAGEGPAAIVQDVSYDGQGCSISQASASVLFELVKGRTVTDALAIQEEFLRLMQGRGTVEADEEVLGDAVAFAGVAKYPARVKCALLSWMAWKDATAQSIETGYDNKEDVR
jgi:nitrogen fixation protein NifU and related proteins